MAATNELIRSLIWVSVNLSGTFSVSHSHNPSIVSTSADTSYTPGTITRGPSATRAAMIAFLKVSVISSKQSKQASSSGGTGVSPLPLLLLLFIHTNLELLS